jgi:hypothetical protein
VKLYSRNTTSQLFIPGQPGKDDDLPSIPEPDGDFNLREEGFRSSGLNDQRRGGCGGRTEQPGSRRARFRRTLLFILGITVVYYLLSRLLSSHLHRGVGV